MDSETMDLLKKCHLEEYINIFQQNRIGINEAKALPLDLVGQLIEPIGDRLKFIKAINSLNSSSDSIAIYNDYDEPSAICKRPRLDSLSESSFDHLENPLTSVANAHLIINYNQENLFENLDSVVNCSTPVQSGLLSPLHPNSQATHTKMSKTCETVSPVLIDKNRKENPLSEQCTQSLSNKVSPGNKSAGNIIKTAEDLKAFLTSCPEGKVILSTFESNGKLNEFVRTKLTALVVDKLFNDFGTKLTNEHFRASANTICELFPTESPGAYYIPPFKESHKQSISKGKLPYRYRNRRNTLKKHGLVSPKKNKNQSGKITINSDTLIPEDEFIQSKSWLRHYSEPWTKVLNLWEKTAPNRLQQLQCNSAVTVAHIFEEWPALKHPLGYTLLCIDFKIVYPEKELGLLNGWNSSRQSLLGVMESRSVKDRNSIIRLICDLDENSTDACKDVTILYLIPALLPPAILTKGKSTSWKPTILESQESFVFHVKTPAEMETALTLKKKKFQTLKLRIQPFVVIVGDTLSAISQSFVIFENTTYHVDSPLAAVDVCFKLFHVLNLEYPPEAQNAWMFVQKYYFDITTKFDKVSCSVAALISEL